jgi:hypothetical protein
MSIWQSIAMLMALLPLEIPDVFREPDYFVVRDGDGWVVQKPGAGARQPFTISQHRDRSGAEFRKRSLPRLRLRGVFVRFDPATNTRTAIADWTGEEDAQQLDTDVREIINRFAPAGARALLQSTSVYMARLSGATGHTAEDSSDHARFVIYVDPFRATGRLHAAATLLHELTHIERYRARGFHANRAAAVLPKEDFVLLGLADEFAAYQAEADLVRLFLDSQAKSEVRMAAREAIRNPELNWPLALSVMLGFEGPPEQGRRIMEARRQVVLDLHRHAGGYWDSRHMDVIDPVLRETVRDWYKRSREWKEISAERQAWRRAERLAWQTPPPE